MPKIVPESKITENRGLDAIASTLREIPFLFREISKDDVGIDGEIEILRPRHEGNGYEATGAFIKVQAKSGASFVTQNSETGFRTPVKRNDLEYWHGSNLPVIFVVLNPIDNCLYWKDVKEYIRSTPNIWVPPFGILFDKQTDILNADSGEKLQRIASTTPSRISLQNRERLFANLLLVSQQPPFIYFAPTEKNNYEEVKEVIHEHLHPFIIVDNYLYTLDDLHSENSKFKTVCEISKTNRIETQEWLYSIDRKRNYIFFLNKLFRSHLYRCGIQYSKNGDCHFFPRRDDQSSQFKQDWNSVRTGRAAPPRTVCKYYEYGLDRFWRHIAARFEFRLLGEHLYLQIIPRYLFTTDGESLFNTEKTGPYTTRIKAEEHNRAVFNHVLFWADYLSQGNSRIQVSMNYRTVLTIEKLPAFGIASFAIPEDPAIFEDAETLQMDLFPVLEPSLDEGEDHEY